MTDFIQGENRYQSTLLPERLDEYIAEDSAVRVIDFSSMSGPSLSAWRPFYDSLDAALSQSGKSDIK